MEVIILTYDVTKSLCELAISGNGDERMNLVPHGNFVDGSCRVS